MAIDKTIRIQDLPPSNLLNNDNLIIINDSDNITRSITFEDFIGSVTGFPDGINILPSPGVPGINFCPEDNTNCGTGIGSPGDCQLTIYVCTIPIINVGPSPDGGHNVDILGNVEIENDLTVNDNTILLGNVNIGKDCNPTYEFVVDSPAYLNCDTFVAGDITIGTECSNTMTINSTATFGCQTNFDGNVNVDADIIIGGTIKPPNGGNLNINIDNITIDNNLNVDGDVIIGVPSSGCAKKLEINNFTHINCITEVGDDITMYPEGIASGNIPKGSVKANFFVGDGSLLSNLNIPGSLTFRGNIDVTKVAPSNPDVGDLYINENSGTANSSFDGIAGETVVLNQFVFYYIDSVAGGVPINKWATGSIQSQDGFVTLSTTQNIFGDKTFNGFTQSRTPTGQYPSEVVNVRYLEDYVEKEITDEITSISGKFVTLDTNQTSNSGEPIIGDKEFTGLVTAVTPGATPDPKQVVTVDYLTGGGFLSVWKQTIDVNNVTDNIIEPTADSSDVTVKTVGIMEADKGVLFYNAPALA